MKKLRKDFPSLKEAIEVTAVANPATVASMENSEVNKEATDKAKAEADKLAKEFVDVEKKAADDAEKKSKKLSEALEMSLFDKVFVDIIKVDGAEDNLHLKFDENDKKFDHSYITVDINDFVDVDALEDVVEKYKDDVEIEETDSQIKFHIVTPKVKTSIPKDLFDEIMTQLTRRGETVRLKDPTGKNPHGKPTDDRGAGYDFEAQVASVDNGNGIIITVDYSHEGDQRGYLMDLDPAKKIAKKYADLGVTYTEDMEVERKYPYSVKKYMKINIPEEAKAAWRDERLANQRNESCKKAKKSKKLNESGELTNSPYKDIIGEYFDYAPDFEFLDLVADVLGRIDFDDFSEDDVRETISDSIIYVEDEWKILEFYFWGDAKNVNYYDAMDNFDNDILQLCYKIIESNKEDSDDAE